MVGVKNILIIVNIGAVCLRHQTTNDRTGPKLMATVCQNMGENGASGVTVKRFC